MVIDVSKHQGSIDWSKLDKLHKSGDLYGVIIRAGYGKNTLDPKWVENYTAARLHGIPVGAYWYAYWGEGTPTQECESFLAAVKGCFLQLGIWYDVEYEKGITKLDKATRTTRTLEGLKVLAASGRYVGLYSSTDMINNRMDYGRLSSYDLWVAQYANKCTCKMAYGLWQYSSSGTIDGITGRVDLSKRFKDYVSITGESKLATGEDAAAETPSGDEADTPRQLYTLTIGPMTGGDYQTVRALAVTLGLNVEVE